VDRKVPPRDSGLWLQAVLASWKLPQITDIYQKLNDLKSVVVCQMPATGGSGLAV